MDQIDKLNQIKSLLQSIEHENPREFSELDNIGFINTMKYGIKQLEELINATSSKLSEPLEPLDIDYKQLECLGNSYSQKSQGEGLKE